MPRFTPTVQIAMSSSNPFAPAACAEDQAFLDLCARAYAADPKATEADLTRLRLGHLVVRFEADRIAGRIGE